MPARKKAYLFLLGSIAIWGAAPAIIKFTLEGIDPLPFLAYRFFISGIAAVFLILILKLKLPKNAKQVSQLSLYGFLATTIALGFLFVGLDRTTVLELGLIGALSPLMIVLGGGLLLREHVTKREKKGIFIALTGTLITIIAPIVLSGNSFKFSGNILLVLFLVSDAGSVLMAKSMLKRNFSPLLIANFAFIVGAFTLIPFAVYSLGLNSLVETVVSLPLKYHLGVWYMALMSGTLAYFLFIRGERSIEAGEAGLFFYLQPIFSIPLAVFWLHEIITLPFIVGALIIAIGVYIAEKR